MADSGRRWVHRPAAARVGAWAWFLLALGNLADVVHRGSGQSARVAFAGILLASALVYLLAFRPALVVDDEGVLARNPLRDVRVPWPALRHVDTTDVLRLHEDQRVHRVWAVRAGHGARDRARRGLTPRSDVTAPGTAVSSGFGDAMAGRTPADHVVDEVLERWQVASAEGRAAGPVTGSAVRWYVPGLVALATCAVLLAVAAVWT